VELPTAQGWVRPVNDVSLRIAAGEFSHSLPVVAQIATRIAVMRAGKLVELAEAEHLLRQPTQRCLAREPASLPAH